MGKENFGEIVREEGWTDVPSWLLEEDVVSGDLSGETSGLTEGIGRGGVEKLITGLVSNGIGDPYKDLPTGSGAKAKRKTAEIELTAPLIVGTPDYRTRWNKMADDVIKGNGVVNGEEYRRRMARFDNDSTEPGAQSM